MSMRKSPQRNSPPGNINFGFSTHFLSIELEGEAICLPPILSDWQKENVDKTNFVAAETEMSTLS